jgi:hypothetical protein
VVTVYFHLSSKLPVRQVTVRRDPRTNQPIEEITLYNKYRDVGAASCGPTRSRGSENGRRSLRYSPTALPSTRG